MLKIVFIVFSAVPNRFK